MMLCYYSHSVRFVSRVLVLLHMNEFVLSVLYTFSRETTRRLFITVTSHVWRDDLCYILQFWINIGHWANPKLPDCKFIFRIRRDINDIQ